MNTNLMPANVQAQHDLQFDLINELLQLDEEATTLESGVRTKLTELKRLSIELQRTPFEEPITAADEASDAFWAEVLRRVVELGIEQIKVWTQPGRDVPLFNATNSTIFIRTFDQNDNLRWIPYASYAIAPRSLAVIRARGTTHVQLDIRGRIHRALIGVAQAFDGNGVRSR